MPPNLEANLEVNISNEEIPIDDNIQIILTPMTEAGNFLQQINLVNNPYISLEGDADISIHDEVNLIPLEQNLRELLIRVTDTEDLSTVTQLKLKVISREITLQYMYLYTPALRELILDGSVVASLRDIGTGLKNLRILRVNRCGLTCIDGVFGFENLEELYASHNVITNVAQCAFLSNLKVIDVRRNFLKHSDMKYLTFCNKLEEVHYEGNFTIENYSNCNKMLQDALSRLKILNGVIVLRGPRTTGQGEETHDLEQVETSEAGSETAFTGYSINFPPRVCF